MNKKFLIITSLMLAGSLLQAAPLGFLEPYNFMIESEPLLPKSKWQWNFFTQTSFDTKSFNGEAEPVNALQIYEPQQNFLGLFQGDENSQFNQLINSIAAGAGGGVNNGQNGLFTPTGDFSGYQVAFLSSYRFHNNCYFKVSLPVYNLQLSNVVWEYTGNNQTFSGEQIESDLVNSFLLDAQNLFDLDLQGWKVSGLGDLAMLLDYIGDFPQGRTVLRNVRVHGRLGLTFPTGVQSNENWLMSQPFGADGSMTMPFGGGLDINLGRYFQCGFRGQFSYIWGNLKERRVPTFYSQTTLLFPSVLPAFKNHGITQLFDLYAQIYNPFGGLSFKVAYEYFYKPVDSLSVSKPGFDYALLNTTQDLDEITRHNFICLLNFDSGFLDKHDKIHPQLGVYVNIPFNGSFMTAASTIGVQLSLDF
ncbi:hypothetical protein KBC04_00030 [Candidatus Babeliales bacterium]|nr:hypothetical protein [Candidatus Babeliales bacterium]MBP9843519.1 hypothetical protein [Candidatus Babeliales bacterium]